MQEAEAALRHAEIVGNVQFWPGRLGTWPRQTSVEQSRSKGEKKACSGTGA